jgi:hypothetical protein
VARRPSKDWKKGETNTTHERAELGHSHRTRRRREIRTAAPVYAGPTSAAGADHANRAGHARAAGTAVTERILLEVLLVIVLNG